MHVAWDGACLVIQWLAIAFPEFPEFPDSLITALTFASIIVPLTPSTTPVMASNDPVLIGLAANAEDPQKGGFVEKRHIPTSNDDVLTTEERPVAPDQFDSRFQTSRWEIWAYYAYNIGNNGLTLFNFAPTAFQNLLYQASGESGVLHFAGRSVIVRG